MKTADSDKVAIQLWPATVGAVVTAFTGWYVARYDLGLSKQRIRAPAVLGAAIIGLLVAIEYFGKRLRNQK
jgi:hypothetical protein